MKVTVEISALLAALKKNNPNADLTSVKAYLLDLAIGAPANEPHYHEEDGAIPIETPRAVEEAVEEAPSENAVLAGLVGPSKTAGQPSVVDRVLAPAKRVVVNRTSGTPAPTAKSQDAKQRKRDEMNALSNMSSKDILEKVLPQGKRGENNQFVDEGFDGAASSQSSGGGDLEIG